MFIFFIISQFQGLIKHLEGESQRIEDMTILGEDLQEKLSRSGSLSVSLKLTNIEALKRSLTDDVHFQLNELDSSLKRWKEFTDSKGHFTMWLEDFKVRSGRFFEKNLDLSTPEHLKVCVCYSKSFNS